MYQKLIIIGNLGREPEASYTPAGEPVTTFSVATSRKFGDKDETTWFRVNVRGKQAESCSQYLHKGSKVLVEGRLKAEPTAYQRKDGTWSSSYEVTAETVRFLTPKGEQVESVDLDVPF